MSLRTSKTTSICICQCVKCPQLHRRFAVASQHDKSILTADFPHSNQMDHCLGWGWQWWNEIRHFLHILATCFTLFHTCSCKIDVVTSPIVPSKKLKIATFISWINPLRTAHQFHSFIVHHLKPIRGVDHRAMAMKKKGLKKRKTKASGGATWSCSSWGNKKRVMEAVVSGCLLHRDCIMHSVCPCITISQWFVFYCTSFII